MSHKILVNVVSVLALVGSMQVQAALINGTVQANCGAVKLDYVSLEGGSNLLTPAGISYNADLCKGYQYKGSPTADGHYGYDLNIGQELDGLLNGEIKDGVQLFDGNEFLGGDEKGWLDVDGDGDLDPGWINLLKQDVGSAANYETIAGYDLHPFITYDEFNNPINWGNLFDFNLTVDQGAKSGRWEIITHANVIEAARLILGDAYFDHLAIMLKTGDAFMVYSFDFNKIFEDQGGMSLQQNYTLAGSWNTSDFRNKKNEIQSLSHIGVAAHDPKTTSDIPAPATLGILGLSILGLVVRRRRR